MNRAASIVVIPLPWTESLAMPEAVLVSRRVRNLKVCRHENMVSHFPVLWLNHQTYG